MKKYRVGFRPQAEADRFRLYRSIADHSGEAVAGAFIDRFEAACMAVETFPARGRRRDDIRPGVRTADFERGATIVLHVLRRAAIIIRIFHGG